MFITEMGADLTIITVWSSIFAYAAGALTYAFSSVGHREKATRFLWTVGCLMLLLHVAFAFHFFHNWSHTAAYVHTARETRHLFGWNWGGGLYINYALIIGWVGDVGWWWAQGLDSYGRRPRWLTVGWHAFLFFMIFNATIVFGSPVARWVGLPVCLALAVAWWKCFLGNKRSS